MAQLAQQFDATTVAPNNFEPLPTGDYVAIIEDSDMRQTKSGNGSYLALTLQVIKPDQYSGRKLFENLNLDNPNAKTVQIAQATLSAICHATGVMNVSDSQQLHNKPMTINVGFQKNDPSRNDIKAFKKLDGGAPSVPAQTAQPAATPQQTIANTQAPTQAASNNPPWAS